MAFLEIFSKKKLKSEEIIIQKPKIIVDFREKQSLIPSILMKEGCDIEFKQLNIGDYIVKNVIIERKTVSDFISSMINKRLINQLQNLQEVENKILMIEGIEEQELCNKEKINENAIRGFILSIIINYKVPIIFTKNSEDSAKFLLVLAKKQEKEKDLGLHTKRKTRDKNEQLQYLIEGFPGIGPKTAKKLLSEFKTLKNIINADIKEIEKLIGKKSEIFKLIDKVYD